MKKISIIIAVCFFGLIQYSCDDFLEIKPKDTVVVSSIEHYRDIMASYMVVINTPNPSNRQTSSVFGEGRRLIMDFTSFAPVLAQYTGEVATDLSKFLDTSGAISMKGYRTLTWQYSQGNTWSMNYRFIGPLNLIISGIETATGTDEHLRNYVQGEAIAWRAYALFKIMQYYAPYKDDNLGIPVHLDPVSDIGNILPKRKTQREGYAQIIDDCNYALSLLAKTPSNNWNCAYRSDFVHAMLAAVYAYKAMSGAAESSDWSNAENHATIAMNGRNLITSSAELKKLFDANESGVDAAHGGYRNDEFFIKIMGGNQPNYLFNFLEAYHPLSTNGVNDTSNPEYYNLYSDTDIRKSVYFQGIANNKYNINTKQGGSATTSHGLLMPFRLAEMYLIKAEALWRQGKHGEARSVLESFVNARYQEPVTLPTNNELLLQEILKERTREFYQEVDYVWLDMKRLGLSRTNFVNGETHILVANDYRYTFPIPLSEIENNKDMIQNPGWDNLTE